MTTEHPTDAATTNTEPDDTPPFRVGTMLTPRRPGHNVDPVDVEAGMRALAECGYDDPNTIMVIGHALNLWRRGEEAAAQKAAIDKSFHGIDLTSWYRVVAAAVAAGTATLETEREKVAS